MKKIMMVGMMGVMLYLQGCASNAGTGHMTSTSSAGSVKDFQSAIRAYDAKKDIAYLEVADKYAVTESEKAILERKMVDYMGIYNVFDVQISVNKKGKQMPVVLGKV